MKNFTPGDHLTSQSTWQKRQCFASRALFLITHQLSYSNSRNLCAIRKMAVASNRAINIQYQK
jgi:hypothetical protein